MKWIKYLILMKALLFVLINQLSAQAKPIEEWKGDYKQLNKELDNKVIGSKEYLNKVDSLTQVLLISGSKISEDELIQLLSGFYQIQKKEKSIEVDFYEYRYFNFLLNYSLSIGDNGKALFYAEKCKEALGDTEVPSMLIPYTQLIIWAKIGNNKEVEKVYDQTRPILLVMVEKLPDDNSLTQYFQGMQFSLFAIPPLAEINEVDKVKHLYETAQQLDSLIRVALPNINTKTNAYFATAVSLFTQIQYKIAMNQLSDVRALADSVEQMFQQPEIDFQSQTIPFQNTLNSLMVQYYIKTRNAPAARKYLNQLGADAPIFNDERSNFYQYNSDIEAIEGNTTLALSLLDSAYFYKERELTTAYTDINQLMYAHTESAFNKRLLEEQEHQKTIQKRWIWAITISSILLLTIALYFFRKEKIQSKRKINSITKMTDAAIEDVRKIASQEERIKIGYDLHDELSASMAALFHQIELFTSEKPEEQPTEYLMRFKENIQKLYNSIRQKSHQLLQDGLSDSGLFFINSIKTLISTALPSPYYETHVDIEDQAVNSLKAHQKIELLKIFQEIITNIIKHSKANEVSVFLFRSLKDGSIIFEVSDNGVGFQEHVGKSSIGLDSIQNRAEEIGGQARFINDSGAVISILIPVKMLERVG